MLLYVFEFNFLKTTVLMNKLQKYTAIKIVYFIKDGKIA
jgi:hypothetical protein